MAILADYQVVNDNPFQLKNGDEKPFSISLPGDTKLDDTKRVPILMFTAWVEGSGPMQLEVDINGQNFITATFNDQKIRTFHEVLKHHVKKGGDINSLQFRCVGGSAALSIGDSVFWYQRGNPDPFQSD